MKIRGLILLIILKTFTCCQNDDACTDRILNTASLESEYGCANTKYQMEIDLVDEFTIIRSQSSFEALVTGSCQPQIDFSTYDLVIGKRSLSNGNTSIDYKLVEDCETGDQVLMVTFHQNDTTEAPNLTYHAFIPKLGDEQGLSIAITIV
ncbi:MAG: hypothetical protein DSY83_12055 [Flavobacteriia bacterium]|nr:MAG: hypothetical protein DSY83_12055 [Flavobacteriia bacterium]